MAPVALSDGVHYLVFLNSETQNLSKNLTSDFYKSLNYLTFICVSTIYVERSHILDLTKPSVKKMAAMKRPSVAMTLLLVKTGSVAACWI